MMDLVDRLLSHDAWTTRELLFRCRELSDAQLDEEFDIGHRSVRATLLHIIRNMEIWTDLMKDEAVRPDAGKRPDGRSIDGLIARLNAAAAALAAVTKPIAAAGRWDDRWVDRLDDPPREKSYRGAIAHVITHSMHHRAQLLYMLRRLGLRDLPEGDVLSWELQARAADSSS